MEPIVVFINNFNLMSWPKAMADWLADIPNTRIIFVDNKSTYPPLLKYYESCQHQVIRLPKNVGHRAPWLSGAVDEFGGEIYAVTDPDLDLSGIPSNVFEILLEGIHRHRAAKCGVSLEINDIPLSAPIRNQVVRWESQYWARRADDMFFHAAVDTTFAVYNKSNAASHTQLRSDRPFTARHLPWYITNSNLDPEYRYFLTSATSVSTWGSVLKKELEKRSGNIEITGNRYVTFSFDDGDIETARNISRILAPDKATFYICTGWVEPRKVKIMDEPNVGIDHGSLEAWSELSRQGHDVGSHTVSHIRAEHPLAQAEYRESLEFIKQIGPGPYSLSFPWHQATSVDAPYDSIRCGNRVKWNDLENLELSALGSWTIFPDDRTKVIEGLRSAMPNNSWTIFCFHGLDGRLVAPWPSSEFRLLVEAIRALGIEVRSVAEMVRMIKGVPKSGVRCSSCGDQDHLKSAKLYLVDWSDSNNPKTPITGDLRQILGFVENCRLGGMKLLDVGIGSSEVAKRLSRRVEAVNGITVIEKERQAGIALGIEKYNIFLLNKYGDKIRSIAEKYHIIIDLNPASFTACAFCARSLFESYERLLAENGFIVTHLAGLKWAANNFIPNAISWELEDLRNCIAPIGLWAETVMDGVVVVGRIREQEAVKEYIRQNESRKDAEKRDDWFKDYQQIPLKGIEGHRKLAERTQLFVKEDFQGAAVLDIGCNIGQMCFQAIGWGAREVVGIDFDRTAIGKARELLGGENISFSCEDLEAPSCWRSLESADVVLFLAVYLTRELSDKEAILCNVAAKARSVLYIEGHEGDVFGYTPQRYIADVVRLTDFGNVEYLGRLGQRSFFRCWRQQLTEDEAIEKLRCIVAKSELDRIVVIGKSASGKSRMSERLKAVICGDYAIYDDVRPPYRAEKFVLFDWRALEYVPDADAVFFLSCGERERLSRIRKSVPDKDPLLRSAPGLVRCAKAVFSVRT